MFSKLLMCAVGLAAANETAATEDMDKLDVFANLMLA